MSLRVRAGVPVPARGAAEPPAETLLDRVGTGWLVLGAVLFLAALWLAG